MAEYDQIAQDYSISNYHRPLLGYASYPSFYDAIGAVEGKSILDLACGDGLIAREMKRRGASEVVGVDLSEKMLEIARTQEQEKPLGITYQQGKVGELGKIGTFDIVAGGFLLHYAENRDELFRMCRDIADNLKPGGFFVALNNNPRHPTCTNPNYGNVVTAKPPLAEGGILNVKFTVEGVSVSFINHYWRKETYEEALSESGLQATQWIHIFPTPEGRKNFGDSFWKDFIENPFLIIIKSQKL